MKPCLPRAYSSLITPLKSTEKLNKYKITFDDMTFELSENVNDFGQSELNAVFNNSVINTKTINSIQ